MTGNPLAVVIDSDGLTAPDMLEITRWLDFSETTFLTTPDSGDADYKVRIFTLSGELPFAGHPTLGTCHVWQSLHGAPEGETVQECGAGLIRLRRTTGRISFEAPPLLREGPVKPEELARLADVLGVDISEIIASRWIDNGPGWVGILLGSAAAVIDLDPDFGRHHGEGALDIGVVGPYAGDEGPVYEVRAFFSDQHGGMVEDPVTGSLNASVAQWLLSEGRVDAPYVASQGTALGRSGRIHITQDEEGSVWVGGNVHDVVEGTLQT